MKTRNVSKMSQVQLISYLSSLNRYLENIKTVNNDLMSTFYINKQLLGFALNIFCEKVIPKIAETAKTLIQKLNEYEIRNIKLLADHNSLNEEIFSSMNEIADETKIKFEIETLKKKNLELSKLCSARDKEVKATKNEYTKKQTYFCA